MPLPPNNPRQVLDRPTITALSGSTKHKSAFLAAEESLTLQGKIVLSPGIYVRADYGVDTQTYFGLSPEAGLGSLHFAKIDMADELFVINVDGYIGASTAREVLFARFLRKPVYWLEEGHVERAIEKHGDVDQLALLLHGMRDCIGPHDYITFAHGNGIAFCCEGFAHSYAYCTKPSYAEVPDPKAQGLKPGSTVTLWCDGTVSSNVEKVGQL